MKYELTDEIVECDGRKLHRIRALKDIVTSSGKIVKKGDLGGWIAYESNLSPCGNSWVDDNACVYDNAQIYGNSKVYGEAEVYNQAEVYDNAELLGEACISDSSCYITIKGLGKSYENTTVFTTKNKNIAVKDNYYYYKTLSEFANQMEEIFGDSKYAKEYLTLVELAKIHFGIEEK